jgi:signal transduction histidine kinase/CheY-like chemotaxis protein/ligand-binding sensor protein
MEQNGEKGGRTLQPGEQPKIRDFCDMARFEQMLKDWAESTGLATVAIGTDGEYISGCYNFTEFCYDLTRKSPEGLRRCIECDRKGAGIYPCHTGLVDFSAPIALEDGTVLGKIVGGQVLSRQPDDEQYRRLARELGIDEEAYLRALRKMNIRSESEIRASADLLANVVNMFVRASYAAWQNEASLTERAEIISSLGKIYFCDYYIDLGRNLMMELDADENLRAFVGSRRDASGLLADSCRYFAEPEFLEEFLRFTDLSTLSERLGDRSGISYDFICRDSGWCRAVFIAVNRGGDGKISHVIYALQHIREEKEAELKIQRTLREAADEANRANRAKSDFLSCMSHDIRTPLNGIIGMTYLAAKQDNPPKTADCLAKIDASSKFLLGLINDILDMAKAESSRIELHPEPYPAEEFCAYLDAIFSPLLQEKRQRFVVDVRPAEGRTPLLDKLRFNQIAFNLLSNAVKYTPAGGIVTCRVWLRQLPGGRLQLRMNVIDNGIGISPEFQKILFDPFTQEGRSDTSENRGSGLGLAIARRMVERMGGTIGVESQVGKGTTFTVEMETDSVPETGSAAAEAAEEKNYAPLRGARILLCEDHPLNQQIAKELLEARGMRVEIAGDGQVGADLFRRSREGYYSAILMDIRMPVMNGYEATAAIRAMDRPDAKTVPVFAMTADAFSDDVKKCLAAGMNGHIPKPVDPAALYGALKDAIAKEENRGM